MHRHCGAGGRKPPAKQRSIIGIMILEATRDIESYELILGDYMNGKDKIIDPMDCLSF